MDAIAEWTQSQQRVIELVEGLDPGVADTVVPACPDWTVRQLLSHMIGLDADVVAGDEPDDHNATWTQKQVDARADHDVATLVAEWRDLTAPVQEWMRANNTRPLGDVVIHEQDLRGALDSPGARDTDALAALRDRMAGRLDQVVTGAGLPGLRLSSPSWSFVAGAEPAAVTVEASEFDLTRALMTRRTADQLRGWVTDGDIEPYLDSFAGLGPLPTTPLPE
ncbi:maleylpyruvate isomerase family mycothiol-dependent enzyme [Jatrophihabitans endophyticus]|uniref:maleylpyruvate isomerase family mycothiol-dependent enzyme n=1 Tax=Jatrophihabitans endophyticus TaxID=1206085 RepID=UPI001A010EC5|nr:maleylpyruvate isomerase family mycothiol-dependent enzyme [Jatrophihabitans endophyticus]MBE7187404.1 maleylpyruvate isomerase family mycothiol-dependent enzyme [Jatrophihabitans endophyticus]